MLRAIPARRNTRLSLLGRGRVLCLIRLVLAILSGLCLPAWAQQAITGVVEDAVDGSPIGGVRVQAQTLPETAVHTDLLGRFELSVTGLVGSQFEVAAALPYDAGLAINYKTMVIASVSPGDNLSFRLERAPAGNNPSYQPAASSACVNCHREQHDQWSVSNHARAAVNVRVRDLYSGDGTIGNPHSARGYVFTDTHAADNSGLCATCHAPNERPADPGSVKFNEVATAAGMEGVTCTSCHQLHVINDDVDRIHLLGNAEFFLPEAGRPDRHVWGPLPDVGTSRMEAFYAPVFSDSRMCASCHEYVTPATGAPGQETYSEWLASPAASEQTTCQDCHMPPAATAGAIAGGGPTRPGSQRRDHSFPGVYSGRLADPVELALVVEEVTADTVRVRSELTSLVRGHHWPTGVDPRNAILVIEARLDGLPLAQVSGDVLPFWASAEPEVAPDAGDYAGRPGRGYAKVLEGRINGEGDLVRPVGFIDAEAQFSKTTLMPGATDIGSYTFSLPAQVPQNAELAVHGRVLYRRVWRDWAVAKGWTEMELDEPWERLVDELTITQTLAGVATHTVTASAGVGGSIVPGSQTVEHGQTATFTVTPDEGYQIDGVTGCGGTLAGNTYTTAEITAVCEVIAAFFNLSEAMFQDRFEPATQD